MNSSQPQVLLIEEDPTLSSITAFRLELLGYAVTTVESGEAALAYLVENLPMLIIVGHFLPGIDGIELLNRLSNDVRTSDIPTILLSPRSDLDDVQKAFNAGADDYLVTPFDPQVLQSKVMQLCDLAS